MKLKRSSLMIEMPSSAVSDVVFILIVFFLVCASVQPDKGRAQEIPNKDEKEQKEEQSQNIEVALTRAGATVNGEPMTDDRFEAAIRRALEEKKRQEDKVVIVKSREDVPYHRWITMTGLIEKAGGIITLELEEEQTTIVE